MEEVFEYSPPGLDAGSGGSKQTTKSAAARPLNREEDVVESSLRVGDAFALFDAKTRAGREGYEAPRIRLARLQREAAEVRAEIDDFAYNSSSELLHEVDELIVNLERMSAGLPPPPPPKGSEDDATTLEEAVRVAKERATQGTEKRRALTTGSDDAVDAAEDSPMKKNLFETASFATIQNEEKALPSLIVSRLAALRSLHEEGFEFAKRLRTAELEERVLRDFLATNDETSRRLVEKVDSLLLLLQNSA